jgi:tetratricopeptide (TPR) repeat protein
MGVGFTHRPLLAMFGLFKLAYSSRTGLIFLGSKRGTTSIMPPEERNDKPKVFVREPLSSAKQKRLDALLAHAHNKVISDKPDFKPDYDYATDLLAQCVLGNPANIFFVKAYIENLQKKFNNNKTGKTLAKLQEIGSRMAQKKAIEQENWDEAIKLGLKVLTVNPWDKTALLNMAMASKKSGDFEVQLYYLKTALIANPTDPEINRECAIALEAIGDINQAITCWHRVEKAAQGSKAEEEAKRNIAVLNTKRMDPKDGRAVETTTLRSGISNVADEILTPEKKLLRKIEQNPDQMQAYVELSEMYLHEERYGDAAKILGKAFESSNGNADIREKWEDAQMRHFRQKISLLKDPVERKKQEKLLFAKELEVCKNRCERFPNNPIFRFDLGYHYMLLKQYNEAIRELQSARNDPRKKGPCLLALGQCFQEIKQYPLAMDHYEKAIEEIPDRDAKNKKKALYLAGRLALGISDLEKAEKHLKILAAMDFTYKDVPTLLDKLAKKRQNYSEGSANPSQETNN